MIYSQSAEPQRFTSPWLYRYRDREVAVQCLLESTRCSLSYDFMDF
jgi:hypothetical protein